MGGIGGSLSSFGNSILDFLSKIVVPDWGQLVALMPLFLFLPVVGFLGLAATLWAWHWIRQPRSRPKVVEGAIAATVDADGRPVYPPGLPHCRIDGLIYPAGSNRCDKCGNDLGVICPMCGVGRDAHVDTCGNCGLVLKISARDRFVRPAGPPPGGAAIA